MERTRGRSHEQGDAEPQPRAAKPPETAPAAILGLQKSAGNAAVARALAQGRVLARQTAAPAAPAATLAQLDEALDHFNVNESRVIEILGQLGDADKRTVLSGGYLTPLAGALNTAEMVRAVRALRAPLWQALEWVKEAAGDWNDIDYPDIGQLVRDADQPQRDALRTVPWRDRFVDICTNATMPDAVIELGHDLHTRIDWLLTEGTNRARLERVIRNSPGADLPAVVADTAMMDRLRSDLSSGDYAVIEKMLRHGLLGEGSIQREYVGNHYSVWAALYRSGLTLFKNVNYVPHGLTAPQLTAYKQAVNTGVDRHLNGKWKVRVASTGARQEGDGDYPIRFRLDERTNGYTINVHAGQGRDSSGEAGAEWYEGGMAGDSADSLIAVHAHEIGHMMLGAPEEYVAPAGDTHDPGRTITSDNSIMGDITPANALGLEIRDRHLTFLTTWAQNIFPGRRVTIVR